MDHSPGCKCGACTKRAHSDVAYEHPSRHHGEHCSGCQHYVKAGPHCTGVRDPIQPEDWCKRFKRDRP